MKKALSGLKVLDLTRIYSGPYCTMLLGDLGAEVIKVEACGRGDDTRFFQPVIKGESGYYMYLNRNKKSITLNLKSEKGKEIALKLAEWADVIVENFSPGTVSRLGLGYEDVKKVNPQIIYASISGFGQYGPYRDKVAYDIVAQAMGGLTYVTGYPEGDPVKTGPAIADSATGVHAAYAIMAAVYSRDRTGEGQYIDIAMMDTVFSMLESLVPQKTMTGVEPERIGNVNPSSAPYNMYRTKNSFIVIATANDILFKKLAHVMGRDDLPEIPIFSTNPSRKQHQKEIDAIVEEWTMQHENEEIEKLLDEAGIPVASVRSIGELLEDPHIKAREMLVEHENPNYGTFISPGNPIKMEKTPADTSVRAPLLGENTDEILEGILGFSNDCIKMLRDEGVI